MNEALVDKRSLKSLRLFPLHLELPSVSNLATFNLTVIRHVLEMIEDAMTDIKRDSPHKTYLPERWASAASGGGGLDRTKLANGSVSIPLASRLVTLRVDVLCYVAFYGCRNMLSSF